MPKFQKIQTQFENNQALTNIQEFTLKVKSSSFRCVPWNAFGFLSPKEQETFLKNTAQTNTSVMIECASDGVYDQKYFDILKKLSASFSRVFYRYTWVAI